MSSSRFSLIEVASRRSHPIGTRTVIGRDASVDIVLDDPMVTRSHAELTDNGDGTVLLRDLGSRHGTFVGRRRISEALLRAGDELLIGPVALRLALATISPVVADSGTEELRRLRAVVELSRLIGVEHDLPALLERLVSALLLLVGADRGAIVVYHPASKTPQRTVTRNRVAGRPPLVISSRVLGQVMADPRPFLRTELADDVVLERSESLLIQDVRSLMVVPLQYEATTPEWLGLIHLDSQGDGPRFHAADLELMVAVASHAALAIKNALLVEQVQAVRDEEWHRLERVVHDLPVGVVVLDDQHRCLLTNPWVTERAEILGHFHPGQLVERVAGVPCADLATRSIKLGDPPQFLELTTASAGDGRETVVVITDVSQQREHQARAAHQDRLTLLGQLAGGVAHDFNNLLSVILNYAGFLEADLDDPTTKQDVRQVVHAANRAAELVRQLLAFSRREAAQPQVVAVGHLLGAFERLLGRTLGEHITLVTTVADDVPAVLIDPAQFEQVMMNLVMNARDAMPDGGRVTITVSLAPSGPDRERAGIPHVMLEVNDTGPGIPVNVLPRVFEPYFTTKPQGKGTGLGLAMVHGIVQQAGGEVVVESTPGQGTTFRIYLPPCSEAPVEHPAAPPIVTAAGATVLVVDDDAGVRALTTRILQRAGYRVLAATDGPSALAVARERGQAIDLLLSDVIMPGMSGREVAETLTSERPTLKVLFMSGYDRGQVAPHQRLITKPFNRDGILGAVADALTDTIRGGRISRLALR